MRTDNQGSLAIGRKPHWKMKTKLQKETEEIDNAMRRIFQKNLNIHR
jgi:hypothetical protein